MTDVPDDRTEVVRRGEAHDVPDEITAPSRRRGASRPDGGPVRSGAPVDDADPDDGSTIVVRRESRRRAEAAAQAADAVGDPDATQAATGAVPIVPGTGRARGLAATLASDVPAPIGRLARSTAPDDARYPARSVPPTQVERTPPPGRAPQAAVDTGAGAAHAERRRRRVLLIVVAAASVIVIAAAIALAVVVSQG